MKISEISTAITELNFVKCGVNKHVLIFSKIYERGSKQCKPRIESLQGSTAKIDASNVQYGIKMKKKLQKLIFDKVHKQGGKQYREASSIDPDKASSRVLIITFM